MAEDLRRAQAYFGDKADAYRSSASHGDRAELARMVELLRPAPGARALDVATGGGHTAVALREAGCHVVTTDATASMRPDVLADAHRLPLRDGRLDVVACRIAAHHFADLDAFVSEAARVLRRGGALYVFDLTTPEDPASARAIDDLERLRDPSHVHSRSPGEWRNACGRARLHVEHLATLASEFPLEPWIARARMPPAREAELRRRLHDGPWAGYGLTREGAMRVLRVELLARKR